MECSNVHFYAYSWVHFWLHAICHSFSFFFCIRTEKVHEKCVFQLNNLFGFRNQLASCLPFELGPGVGLRRTRALQFHHCQKEVKSVEIFNTLLTFTTVIAHLREDLFLELSIQFSAPLEQ